jgi:hypothetical protein
MKLHENEQLFADAINAASRPITEGGLGIKSIFIEKDYWICRSLKMMAEGDKDGKAVFKGGTSISILILLCKEFIRGHHNNVIANKVHKLYFSFK